MVKNLTEFNNKFFILVTVAFALFLFSACTSSSTDSENSEEMGEMEDMEHEDGDMTEMNHDEEEMDDHDMEDMDHEDPHDGVSRIPNQDGATISIVGPEDGSTFAHGEQIIVEVAVENFALDNDGSHWHIYIDGSSWGMVMGQNTEQALTGIEPGEHEIAAYLAIGTHEEFEDGDSIMITVE